MSNFEPNVVNIELKLVKYLTIFLLEPLLTGLFFSSIYFPAVILRTKSHRYGFITKVNLPGLMWLPDRRGVILLAIKDEYEPGIFWYVSYPQISVL